MGLEQSMQPSLASLSEVDLIVLGSGAAGLTAALTATLEGLTVAVLEVAPVIGGTTARSSGTVWIPNNQLMKAAGFPPDDRAAEAYLSAVVGDHGPKETWTAFLEQAPEMQADLEARAGIVFRPFMSAPDYQSELEGAAPGGRALEPTMFDGRLLGSWFEKLAEPMRELTVFGGMMLTRAEAQRLMRPERSPAAILRGSTLLARHLRDRMHHKRGTRLVMGNALVARLLHETLFRGGYVFTDTTVHEVHTEAGRGIVASGVNCGRSFNLRARAGIVLAGGGFPADPELRKAHLPSATPDYTPAAPHARGSTIRLGLTAGGRLGPVAGLNAMWFPSSLWARPDGGLAVYPHIALDRAKPGSIIVDQEGARFASEALSYHDFCTAMFRRGPSASPAWMIAGRAFIWRYGLGVIRPRTPSLKSFIASGYLKSGKSLEELALALDIPGEALRDTISRFNDNARRGSDPDFNRGMTAYERSNGDSTRRLPNPCLGEIENGMLFAVALWPTPLATARGLVCNEWAQVLDATDEPIPGLYAAGNDMQSVFGGQYPGAGAQIGPAMTFGWAAARHAARRIQRSMGE